MTRFAEDIMIWLACRATLDNPEEVAMLSRWWGANGDPLAELGTETARCAVETSAPQRAVSVDSPVGTHIAHNPTTPVTTDHDRPESLDHGTNSRHRPDL